MRTLVVLATLPFWLPVLVAAGSASIAIGLTCVVLSRTIRYRHEPDGWDNFVD